jgi:hypothetical protein
VQPGHLFTPKALCLGFLCSFGLFPLKALFLRYACSFGLLPLKAFLLDLPSSFGVFASRALLLSSRSGLGILVFWRFPPGLSTFGQATQRVHARREDAETPWRNGVTTPKKENFYWLPRLASAYRFSAII